MALESQDYSIPQETLLFEATDSSGLAFKPASRVTGTHNTGIHFLLAPWGKPHPHTSVVMPLPILGK